MTGEERQRHEDAVVAAIVASVTDRQTARVSALLYPRGPLAEAERRAS